MKKKSQVASFTATPASFTATPASFTATPVLWPDYSIEIDGERWWWERCPRCDVYNVFVSSREPVCYCRQCLRLFRAKKFSEK